MVAVSIDDHFDKQRQSDLASPAVVSANTLIVVHPLNAHVLSRVSPFPLSPRKGVELASSGAGIFVPQAFVFGNSSCGVNGEHLDHVIFDKLAADCYVACQRTPSPTIDALDRDEFVLHHPEGTRFHDIQVLGGPTAMVVLEPVCLGLVIVVEHLGMRITPQDCGLLLGRQLGQLGLNCLDTGLADGHAILGLQLIVSVAGSAVLLSLFRTTA
mmetsp:Transcript_6386/g.11679  ORF Transcript_6386/g.11679 Transcript_6386/m.11679 type:complete len:213 (-) Transcript_6386:396-1034(-)